MEQLITQRFRQLVTNLYIYGIKIKLNTVVKLNTFKVYNLKFSIIFETSDVEAESVSARVQSALTERESRQNLYNNLCV